MQLTKKDIKCDQRKKQVAELKAHLEQARDSGKGYRNLASLYDNANYERKTLQLELTTLKQDYSKLQELNKLSPKDKNDLPALQESLDARKRDINTSQAALEEKHAKFDQDLQSNRAALRHALDQNKILREQLRSRDGPAARVKVAQVTTKPPVAADSPPDESRDRHPGSSPGTPSTSSSWGDRPIPKKK